MKVVLLNQNPVISRLVKLSMEKIGYELEEIENITQIEPWSCDLLICDHEMLDESVDYTPFGKEILFLIPRKYEKKLGKHNLEKPFLPTDFIDKVQKIISLSEYKEEESVKPRANTETFSDNLDDNLANMYNSFDDFGANLDGMFDGIEQKEPLEQKDISLDEDFSFVGPDINESDINESASDEIVNENIDENLDEEIANDNENFLNQEVDTDNDLKESLDEEIEFHEDAENDLVKSQQKEAQLAEISSIVDEIENLDTTENLANEAADKMTETEENSAYEAIDDVAIEEKEEIFDNKPPKDLADLDSISGFVPPENTTRIDDEIPENFTDLDEESEEQMTPSKEEELARLKEEIRQAEEKIAKILEEQDTASAEEQQTCDDVSDFDAQNQENLTDNIVDLELEDMLNEKANNQATKELVDGSNAEVVENLTDDETKNLEENLEENLEAVDEFATEETKAETVDEVAMDEVATGKMATIENEPSSNDEIVENLDIKVDEESLENSQDLENSADIAKSLSEQDIDDVEPTQEISQTDQNLDTELEELEVIEENEDHIDEMQETQEKDDLGDILEQNDENSLDIEKDTEEISAEKIASEDEIDEMPDEATDDILEQNDENSLDVEKDTEEIPAEKIASEDEIDEMPDEAADQISPALEEVQEITNEAIEEVQEKAEDLGQIDEFAGINESDLAGALGLAGFAAAESIQEKQEQDNIAQVDEAQNNLAQDENLDIQNAKAQISEELTETLGAALANSKLKDAIKGMKIKINISFDE